MRISVVVPTLGEAERLPRLLSRLQWMPVHEVVVSDGGSEDGTAEVARRGGARVVVGVPGRGRQLDTGARAATGDVLWFVHADTLPPVDAVAHIRRALADARTVAGAFHIRTLDDGGRRRLGPLLRVADLRSRWSRRPYGDQALFVRRSAYDAVGGFSDRPLLEDVELSRRLARHGRVARVPAEVKVSGRRMQNRPLYYLAAFHLLPVLDAAGVAPERLRALYPHER